MKQILFYCQHVLGMGHLMRSMALIEGMIGHFNICFLNGGEPIAGFDFPAAVEVINLPPLKTDETFKTLSSSDGEELTSVQQTRRQQIIDVYTRIRPDIVVIELFPFGRKKLANELGPLLARIRLENRPCKVVCSLRDILVQRPDPERYEAQVCDTLNRYFDLLLVHSDPQFQRLEESFAATNQIQIAWQYTGYVVQQGKTRRQGERENGRGGDTHAVQSSGSPLILASIGGGRVGYELLAATVEASILLATPWPHRLLIFTGPYLPDDQFALLQQAVAGHRHIDLQRYTPNFVETMAQATLSISMAGYNTCMNVLTTGVRALMLPFTGSNNDEQTIRLHKLAAQGLVQILSLADLSAERLATRITDALQSAPPACTLDIAGAEKTTTHLLTLLEQAKESTLVQSERRQVGSEFQQNHRHSPQLFDGLHHCLEAVQAEGRTIDLFLRDDDIDDDEESLRHLVDIALMHDAPLTLAVIPGLLTLAGITLLKNFKKFYPSLIELHQHGWCHLNHESNGRKCEFGSSRSFAKQWEDIDQGKRLLEQVFDDKFFPAFTPPWNRFTEDTPTILEQLNFAVFSSAQQPDSADHRQMRQIPITLDLLRWKNGAELKPPSEIIDLFTAQTQHNHPIGLLLHHKVMNNAAFGFLEQFLAEVRRHSCVRIHTFQTLLCQQ